MRALFSVADKTGVVELMRGLEELGVEIYATGGTYSVAKEAGINVQTVESLTETPELLGGRVKTLHPAIHAGILARRDVESDMIQLAEQKITPIDIVVSNLYPFVETAQRPDVTLPEAIEQIDIGGAALIRASAKNFKHVLVVIDPKDYESILATMKRDGLMGFSESERRSMAAKAFQYIASYDTIVAQYLRPPGELFPKQMTFAFEKVQDLRYGENPHQRAAYYAEKTLAQTMPNITRAKQLHGKNLSFNNTLDIDAALNTVKDFAATAVAIIKHGNPAGIAIGNTLAEAYQKAHAGDPLSAFGGAVALNRVVDEATAREIAQTFYEDIVAPGYEPDALEILKKKRDLRILQSDFQTRKPLQIASEHRPIDILQARTPEGLAAPSPIYMEQPPSLFDLDFKRISGGMLLQTLDELPEDDVVVKVVTRREPTLDELTNLLFTWRCVKHCKSNAAVLAKRLSLVGVGAGQMSRIDAVELAIKKAGDRSVGTVMAVDSFFPKPDSVEIAASGGVTAIIQPGGSIRDEDVIKAADKHHIAMIMTGQRHYRH